MNKFWTKYYKMEKEKGDISWDKYWRNGEVEVVDNPPFGVIYYCRFDYGWDNNKEIVAFKTERMPSFN